MLNALVSMKGVVSWALLHPFPLAELSLLICTSSVSSNLCEITGVGLLAQ